MGNGNGTGKMCIRDRYYSDAVAWAVQNDIVEGYSEAEFGPNDAVTREQLVAILYRYAVSCGYDVSATIELSGYEDADIVSDYAKAVSYTHLINLKNIKYFKFDFEL